MNKFLLTTGLMALLSVGAQAGVVTYTTGASELCIGAAGCGVSSQTIGGIVTVSFVGTGTQSVDASPSTFSSLGDIIISCVGGGTGCGSVSLSGLNLFINISQTVPTVGSGSISGGVIAGSISGTSSSAQITWAVPNAINIGNISYGVANNPLALVPVSSLKGDTTVQGIITDHSVPEPSTYALLASGLVGLGLMRRRK